MFRSAAKLLLSAFALSSFLGFAQAADDQLVQVSSPHSVTQTADNLVAAVENAGAKVFARIDHALGGKNVGMEIPANEVVIFGNPQLGTPVIRDAPKAGLDLPIRVAVIETSDGTVIVYRAPAALAAEHGLPADHPSIKKMTGALNKLTAKAAE
ncbi:MAG: DUF302 domain-containing protein [Roseibium sp.]|uniref:DUF302 domain-containing protein n=1 Tax=Roseibium sp. TaxID=1936156 RepID=UPI00260BAFC8|nr:DUF302 domain-containing protein [Roseibium sp.]MCV0426447.1 DUF302 domain-containing protein [Roseibium sp.]